MSRRAVDRAGSRSSTKCKVKQKHEEHRRGYLLQLFGNTTREEVEAMSEEERGVLYAEWGEFRRLPGITPAQEMSPPSSATTVRVENGSILTTDGPFAETKEALGGFFFLDADDLDQAIEIAAQVPTAKRGGSVEIRPLIEY